MSFMEILQQAREEAKKNKAAETLMEFSKEESVPEPDVNAMFSKGIEEDTTQPPPVPPPEAPQPVPPPEVVKSMQIGDKIVEISGAALKSKLSGTGAAKRLAKSISVKRHITTTQLQKAFAIQDRFKPSHINYKLVGGDAMMQLKTLLQNGTTLGAALETLYKD